MDQVDLIHLVKRSILPGNFTQEMLSEISKILWENYIL
jgi:hypothetical protein